MRISNSKIKTFRRCQKQYEFKYIRKLEPKAKAIALERGTWIHDLLMHYYDGEDWKGRHKELTRDFYAIPEEIREDLGDLPQECLRIMRGYIRRWGKEDDQYTVVDSELDEIITLPNGLELNIIIDLILEDQRGGLWAFDHKTRKNFSDEDSMLLDPQLTLYYGALEMMGYKPLRGVVYNEIRTKPPTVPKLLKRGGLSKAKNIDTNVHTYMAEIRKHDLDPNDYRDILLILARRGDQFFKRSVLPKDPPVVRRMFKEAQLTANEMIRTEKRGEYIRTFDLSCKWGCAYKDLCIAELHGGDISSMVKMNFKVRRRGGEAN